MRYSEIIPLALGITGALAAPRQARRGTANSQDNVSSPWGGAVQETGGWTYVTGTVTIPHISGQDPNSAVAMWVGIDGYECQNAIWQTGITVYGNGYIENWYEWWPHPPVTDSKPFQVSAGDQIRMTVHATSSTSGNSTLENLTTGKSTSTVVSNQGYELCFQDAEWIVEDFDSRTLADFGTISFTNNQASNSRGNYGPGGSRITEVVANGQTKTNCAVSGNNVNCRYTGN